MPCGCPDCKQHGSQLHAPHRHGCALTPKQVLDLVVAAARAPDGSSFKQCARFAACQCFVGERTAQKWLKRSIDEAAPSIRRLPTGGLVNSPPLLGVEELKYIKVSALWSQWTIAIT